MGLGRGKKLHITSKPMSPSVFTKPAWRFMNTFTPHFYKNFMLLSLILFNKRTIELTSWTLFHGGNN